MTRTLAGVVLAVATLVAGAAPSDAQRSPDAGRPPEEQRRRHPLRPSLQGQVATICSNEAGWCPLPEEVINYSMYPGRPVSPYFNPHWTDAPPPAPVLK